MDYIDIWVAMSRTEYPVPVLICEGCGLVIEADDLVLETWEGWSDDTVDDLDAPCNTINHTVSHRWCKEQFDHEFERGWNEAKGEY